MVTVYCLSVFEAVLAPEIRCSFRIFFNNFKNILEMFIRSSSFDKIWWNFDTSFGAIIDDIDGSNILCTSNVCSIRVPITGNICSIRVPLTGRKLKKAGIQLQAIDRKPRVFSNKVAQSCRSIDLWGREFWIASSCPKRFSEACRSLGGSTAFRASARAGCSDRGAWLLNSASGTISPVIYHWWRSNAAIAECAIFLSATRYWSKRLYNSKLFHGACNVLLQVSHQTPYT